MKSLIRFSLLAAAVLLVLGCATPPPPIEEIPEPLEAPPPPEQPELEPPAESLALVLTMGVGSSEAVTYSEAAAAGASLAEDYLVLFIDRGSSFSGSDFTDTDEAQGVVTLKNAVGYQAMGLNTGDFFHDAFRLEELADQTEFPIIGTNLTGADWIPKYGMVEAGGTTLAVLSLLDDRQFNSLHSTLIQDIRSLPPADALLETLQQLQEQYSPDVFLILSQTDLTDSFSQDELEQAAGMLTGGAIVIQQLPMEMTELSGARLLGSDLPLFVLLLHMEAGTLSEAEVIAYDDDLEPDPEIAEIRRAVLQQQKLIAEQAMGYAEDGLEAPDAYGLTPLMNALQYERETTVIGVLLREGADVSARDDYEMTPLMYAAWLNPNPRVTNLLLRSSASVRAQDIEGWTPLMRAVTNENPEVLKAILDLDIDVDAPNAEGWTALMYAAGFGADTTVARKLLDAGADVNAVNEEGMTPLMYAAGFNHSSEMVKLLLEDQADAAVADEYGNTALEYAMQNRHIRDTEAMELLREAFERQQ